MVNDVVALKNRKISINRSAWKMKKARYSRAFSMAPQVRLELTTLPFVIMDDADQRMQYGRMEKAGVHIGVGKLQDVLHIVCKGR